MHNLHRADSDSPLVLQEKQVNFLPRLTEKVSTPEGVPRLFDLIKVQDERMKLAFFAALGNTVVAKDIDQVGHLYFYVIFLLRLVCRS